MSRTEVWMQLGVRIHEKFEVLHIAKKLKISTNECVGALIRLWGISITDFPEGQGKLTNGSLHVEIDHLPVIMNLDNSGQDIFEALKDCWDRGHNKPTLIQSMRENFRVSASLYHSLAKVELAAEPQELRER